MGRVTRPLPLPDITPTRLRPNIDDQRVWPFFFGFRRSFSSTLTCHHCTWIWAGGCFACWFNIRVRSRRIPNWWGIFVFVLMNSWLAGSRGLGKLGHAPFCEEGDIGVSVQTLSVVYNGPAFRVTTTDTTAPSTSVGWGVAGAGGGTTFIRSQNGVVPINKNIY